MIKLKKMMGTRTGVIVCSILLGLGLASIFKISCDSNDCLIFKAPDDMKDKKIIQLDKISNLFFDTIKLIENAKEIYCIDSVWSNFIYLLDVKYKVLRKKNIPIYITCNRGYSFMYENPHLVGWNLLNTPI